MSAPHPITHFLSHRVRTPKGEGILQQVFGGFVRVSLNKSPDRMERFHPEEVLPVQGVHCPIDRVPVPVTKKGRVK